MSASIQDVLPDAGGNFTVDKNVIACKIVILSHYRPLKNFMENWD